MEKIIQRFSENLKKQRKLLGLTQAEFASLIGYSEKAVSKWENGGALPPTTSLILIADKLKMTLDELLNIEKEAEYYLGIDGGATKTRFLLVDGNGKILKDITLKSCNPVDIGFDNACAVLTQGINTVLQKIPYSKVSVCAGISGGGIEETKKGFAEFLSGYNFCSVINGNDLIGLCALNLQQDEGIAIIVGTGLSALVSKGGNTIRMGGYGYMIEEGGDGFSLGREVLRAALKYEDGYGKKTLLYQAALNKCKKKTIFQAVADIYKSGKREVASYAPLAFDAFDKGDEVAKDIIEHNCKCVAELIDGSVDKFFSNPTTDNKVKIVLTGGLVNRSDIILPNIKKHLKNIDKCDISASLKPAVYGNIILAGYKGEIYE